MHESTGCPDDYSELYKAYFPMIKGLVAKGGICPEDVEDVAMDILVRFMEKDGISWYDPDKVFDVTTLQWGGKQVGCAMKDGPQYRTAKFKGMLRQYVVLSTRHYVDRQNSRAHHEPFRLDHPVSGVDHEGEATWADAYFLYESRRHEFPTPRTPTEDTVEVYDAIFSARRLREQRVCEALRAVHEQEVQTVQLDRKSRQRVLWEARKRARKAVEDAYRRERAVLAAAKIAYRGERVSGSAVARECGWNAQTGVEMLRAARADLKVSGL